MSRRRSWLSIETREFLPFAVAIFVLLCLGLGSTEAERYWVWPSDELAQHLWLRAWSVGALTGFLQMGWEDLTASRAYLLHRGLDRRRVWRACFASGQGYVLIYLLGPLLVHAVCFRLLSSVGPT